MWTVPGKGGKDLMFAYFNGCFVENVFEWERDMLEGYIMVVSAIVIAVTIKKR